VGEPADHADGCELVVLMADSTVDPLSQQVGVTTVSGELLEHVDENLAQLDGATASHRSDNAEVTCTARELLGETDFVPPGTPRLRDHARIGSRIVVSRW
jgi:hypothetical protein